MMDNTEAYLREKELFEQAKQLPPAERESFVREVCGDDQQLAQGVLALLVHHASAAPTLDESESAESSGFQVENTSAGALPTIDNYNIIRQIGEGGFGNVYLAEQTKPLRRTVAIKVIKQLMILNEAGVARFDQERQALAAMQHPHVAEVYDAGFTDDGRPYFAMEFIDGEEITKYCHRNCLGLEDRIALFQQVCQAVQHAHHKGVIHRDLKPANVLVSDSAGLPQVKVIDFGIAKAVEKKLSDETIHTSPHMFIGTPTYVSPEQTGTDTDIDLRSDIYSLGVLLYELLAGALPFDQKTFHGAAFAEIQRIIREVDPPKPSVRARDQSRARQNAIVPEDEQHAQRLPATGSGRSTDWSRKLQNELDWIIMKCLEKERERRYKNASELQDDLTRYLKGEPVLAGPPSKVYRFKKFARRNRGALAAVCLIFGILIAALFFSITQWMRAEDQRILAVKAQEAEKERAEEAEEARKEMEVERTIAQQVNRLFTHDLLVAVGSEGGADEITMRAIFEAAGKRLQDNLFPDEPLARAATHGALGVGFRVLSDYEKATEHLESALSLRREHAKPSDPHTAGILEELSVLYSHLGEYARAEKCSREALQRRIAIYGHDNLAVAESLNNIGHACQEQNKLSEAEDYLLRSLSLFKQLLPESHPYVLTVMNNIGSLYSTMGDFDSAAEMYEQSLATKRAVLEPFHPDIIVTANNLGLFYMNTGNYEKAEPLLLEAVEGDVYGFGEDDPRTLVSRSNLAILYKSTNRFDLAQEIYEDVLARRRDRLGNEHSDTWSSMSNLAMLYEELGRYDDARALIEGALELCTSKNDENHPKTLLYMNNLASIERAEGNTAEAAAILSDVVERARNVLPETHLKIAAYLTNYGGTLGELGEYQRSENALLEAESMYSSQVDPAHVDLIEVRSGLVSLYTTWHAAEPGQGYDIKAAHWRARLPADHPEYAPLPEGGEPMSGEELLRDSIESAADHPGAGPQDDGGDQDEGSGSD